ncbi:Protein kinase alk2 [Terramyces sp. JEL0728]|nr:Protein kinase alk2 [Terramyces sp. JEL0728]
MKDYYRAAAGAVGLVSAICWYFRNDAVGTKRIDSKVQRLLRINNRAKSHLPVVGTTFSFLSNIGRMSEYVTEEVLDPDYSGAKVFSNLFMEPLIIINDPESLEYVMNSNFDNYVKGPLWGKRVSEFLGHGIFNSDGQDWYMQRKLASKIFTARAFKSNIETVFADNIQTFLQVIKDRDGQAVDLHDLFHRFFMDSFGEIAFGIEIQSLTKDKVPFAQAFDRIQKVTSERFFNPFFNLTDKFIYPNFNEDIKLIREFGLQVINDRRKEENLQRNDLLSLFMNYENEDGSKLTDDQLIDHVLNFLIAGRDTTAQGLSWTFYSLFTNPQTLESLQNEINASLQDEMVPNYDTVKKMKYANAVFKESCAMTSNWKEKMKDYYMVGAAAVGVASALYWYYKDDAIGSTVKVDKSVKRSTPRIANELLAPDFENAKTISIPFSEPYIFVNDPESVEYVTSTNFDNYVKGRFTKCRMTDVLGNGIFNTDGHDWYVQRKLASKVFTNKNFKTNIDTVFTDNINILLKVLNEYGTESKSIDMHNIFHRYFMDSFGKIAYGIDLQSLEKGSAAFVASFDRAQNAMGDRFVGAFWVISDRFNSQLQRDIKLIRGFGRKVVEDRQKQETANNHDLLSLFMEYRNEDGTGLTNDELADHVINFILAGRDTTAQALSWCLFCLHQNPKVKEQVFKEIDESLGDDLIPKYEQIKKMKYINAVFKETLRLYPSVPREGKSAINDDILPNGTKIPKGAIVSWLPYAMGRSSNIWESPEEFKPERWLSGKHPTQYEFPSFNCGPRICLGKSLAEIQGVFALVSILRQFDFNVENPGQVTMKQSLTLPMKYGLTCSIAHRC